MAKGKSKKSAKSDDAEATTSSGTAKKASVPRGVRKHLRELESQLTDAARKEQKRVQKLERAAQRRESIGSALEKLRSQTSGPASPASPTQKAAPVTAPKPPASKTGTARPPAARSAARTARKAAPPAAPAGSDKSSD